MRFKILALVGILSSSALAVPKANKRASSNSQPINDSGKGAPLLGQYKPYVYFLSASVQY